MAKIINTVVVRNVKELIEAIDELVLKNDRETVYLETGDKDHITLRLVENTLTDGSKTYDIRVS